MNRATVSYTLYRTLLWLWDLITLNVAIAVTTYLIQRADVEGDKEYIIFFCVFNLAWLSSVSITTLYLNKYWLSVEVFLKNTFKSYMLTLTGVLFFIFLYKYPFSRLFIFSSLGLFALLLFMNRVIFHFLVVQAKEKFKKKVVIIGNNEISKRLVAYFRHESKLVTVDGIFSDDEHEVILEKIPAGRFDAESEYGFGAKGFYRSGAQRLNIESFYDHSGSEGLAVKNQDGNGFATKPREKQKVDMYTPHLGSISDCLEYVKVNRITEIYSTISPEQNKVLYELAQNSEQNLIHFKFVLDLNLFLKRKFHIDFINDLPVLSLRTEPLEDIGNRIRKRLLDICVSSFAIIFILSWLTPLMAILIKLESRGPVFFRQLRSGRNNKPFSCLKFRSLRVNDESDTKQVTLHDNRITRVGRFIRKTNIDELPQFFNVFLGEMSVVGPRPHMLKHTEEFYAMYKDYIVRHFVKPGLTGLAQVNGYRGEIKKPEFLKKRIEKDIYYLENWSLWFDLKIILATILVTFEGDRNAY